MKTAVITLSSIGARVAERIASGLPETDRYVHQGADYTGEAVRFENLAAVTAEVFPRYHRLIYVAPCGAVVRTIAPNIRHKLEDPAVVVVDVGARYVVSLLSGHEGGANELAVSVANVLGAEPVITTTSDAVKDLIVGVGCRRATGAERIVRAVHAALAKVPEGDPAVAAIRGDGSRAAGSLEHVTSALGRVRLLASADIKRHEPGLIAAARALGVPLLFVPSCDIQQTRRNFTHSDLAQRKVNLPAVAEPAALLAGRRTQFIVPKTIIEGVAVAVAKEDLSWSASVPAALSTEPDEPSKP